MNVKGLITAILILFVISSLVFFVINEGNRPGAPAVESKVTGENLVLNPEVPSVNDKIIVYYFHGNRRCKTCIKIEALTREAVETGFASNLNDGSVVLNVVNIDEPENTHYVDDYKLSMRSVVLSKHTGGEESSWRRLDKVWDLVDKEAEFDQYIHDEITDLIAGDG